MSRSTTATVARISALIARATHAATPSEEARTSAFIACKLMAENGVAPGATVAGSSEELEQAKAIAVKLAVRLREVEAAFSSAQDRASRLDAQLDRERADWARREAALRAEMAQGKTATGPAPEAAQEAAAPAPQASRPGPRKAWRCSSFRAPKEMHAKYAGRCTCCGEAVNVGDHIFYDGNDRTVAHYGCATGAEAAAQ